MKTYQNSFLNCLFSKASSIVFIICLVSISSLKAQFIHPGLSHKKSDLDRMKYMVETKSDPWYASYVKLAASSYSSYNYVVKGNTTLTTLYRDAPYTNLKIFESDSRAAYQNALMWHITSDTRYADKAVECLNAWIGLTYIQHTGTRALTSCLIYQMVEAAEIIKSTYSGWSTSEIEKFKAMLVYPGYSNTKVPTDLVTQGTWYWRSYMFDNYRAGNQELGAIRACLAMGVFLDNQIMYDRALRYVSNLPHRSDDLAYASGPHKKGTTIDTTKYQIGYNVTTGTSTTDYGFNGVLVNYIYANGQCQESSRDQVHTMWGEHLLCSVGEIAWNQGTDFWNLSDARILKGLEYNMRYSVSYVASYTDQTKEWTPTVASGEFIQGMDRTNRTMSLAINPYLEDDTTRIERGTFNEVEAWELPSAHYLGRGLKTASETKWTVRARDKSIELNKSYETSPSNGAYLGYGGLTYRRPTLCYGDPISGFATTGLPNYNMNVLPATIEAENFDFSTTNGNGRTYNDLTTINTGTKYRTNESVDIETCNEGGFNLSNLESGEWLTYTVYIPTTGTYKISARYAASNSNGTIKFAFGGVDKTSEVDLPLTGGLQTWKDYAVADGITLTKGVQNLKIYIGGTSSSFNLNKFTVSTSTNSCANNQLPVINLQIPAPTGIAPATVALTANATDADGTISKVEFYQGTTLISTDVTSPYTFSVTGLAKGTYSFTAKATDNCLGVTTSAAVSFTSVDPCANNQLPIINLQAPAPTGVSPATLALTAIANDPDGTLSKVEFYQGTTLIATELTSPYTFDVKNLAKGTYSFTAKATDNCSGVATSTAFSFTVKDPCDGNLKPIVTLLTPETSVVTPTAVSLTAIANDPDGTINKVEFYRGTTLISTDATTPYTFSVPTTNLAVGNYTFYAKATDNCLADTTAVPVSVCLNSVSYLQAECYNDMSGIQTEVASEGTENIGWINNGDWTMYNNVDLTGIKSINARMASKATGGTIEVRVGSITGTLLGTLTVPITGGNQVWKTDSTNLSASIGAQNIYLVYKGTGTGYLFNVNYFGFSKNARVITDVEETNISELVKIYPNPFTDIVRIDLNSNTISKVEIYNQLGQLVSSQTSNENQFEFDLSNENSGLYIVKISNENQAITRQILKK